MRRARSIYSAGGRRPADARYASQVRSAKTSPCISRMQSSYRSINRDLSSEGCSRFSGAETEQPAEASGAAIIKTFSCQEDIVRPNFAGIIYHGMPLESVLWADLRVLALCAVVEAVRAAFLVSKIAARHRLLPAFPPGSFERAPTE